MNCHTKLVEVGMIQGAVTPVKYRGVYPDEGRVAFSSLVVVLLNK